MHYAFFVRGFERLCYLTSDRQRLFERQRPRFEPIGERRPFDQLHDDGVVFQAVNHRDVGMIQRCEHLSFALEASQAVGMLCQRRGQNFYGNVAVELSVARTVDLAHAACAQGREDFVGAETGSSG
jgi:hypothetical protein